MTYNIRVARSVVLYQNSTAEFDRVKDGALCRLFRDAVVFPNLCSSHALKGLLVSIRSWTETTSFDKGDDVLIQATIPYRAVSWWTLQVSNLLDIDFHLDCN